MNGRRIAVNALASYLRSVFSVLIGLFSLRWVLAVLGSSDLGLYGVVGGVVFVFSFLTPALAISVGRFYAFSMEKPFEVRRWFNTAFLVMTVASVALVVIAYPVGRFALGRCLVVPDGRMDAAVWVLRCALLTAFASMVSTPYVAMFTAKQDIVELSFYQFVQPLLTFVFVVFMRIFCGDPMFANTDWLEIYAVALAGVAVVVTVLQAVRARMKYGEECALSGVYMKECGRIKPLLIFSGWQFLGGFAWMVRSQGLAFFVNIVLGTSYNTSYEISNRVSNQASALSASLTGALSPALATEEGGGRRSVMLHLARNGSLLGGALVLLFAVPLAVFVEPVLKLWLGNPPPGCAPLCVAMLIVAVVRQFAAGYGLAILAHGKLGPWQMSDAVFTMLSVPLAYVLWKCGLGLLSVGWAFVISEIFASVNRFVFARRLKGESA